MADPAQSFQQARAQLEWAPALANGAAMLALAGIVGNGRAPDTALAGLNWPLVCLGSGLLLGCIALHLGLTVRQLHVRMDVAAELNSKVYEKLVARMEALGEHNEGAHAELGRQMRSDIEMAREQLDLLSQAFTQTLRLQDWPGRLNLLALGSCALGFLVLLAGHALGLLWLEAP